MAASDVRRCAEAYFRAWKAALAKYYRELEDSVERQIPAHLDHVDGHDLGFCGLPQGDGHADDLGVHARARERDEDAFQLHGSRESSAMNPPARAV